MSTRTNFSTWAGMFLAPKRRGKATPSIAFNQTYKSNTRPQVGGDIASEIAAIGTINDNPPIHQRKLVPPVLRQEAAALPVKNVPGPLAGGISAAAPVVINDPVRDHYVSVHETSLIDTPIEAADFLAKTAQEALRTAKAIQTPVRGRGLYHGLRGGYQRMMPTYRQTRIAARNFEQARKIWREKLATYAR